MYKFPIDKIIKVTTKSINEVRKAFIKDYLTGRIKASRKHFK